MRNGYRFALTLAFAAAAYAPLPRPLAAQDHRPLGDGQAGIQLGLFTSRIDRALLREPSGSGEVPFTRRQPARGLSVGVGGAGDRVAASLGVSYWSVDLYDQRYVTTMQETISYSDASVRYLHGDLGLFFAPIRVLPLAIGGVFGMGAQTKQYHVSGSTFSDWNGDKKLTEFSYAYGLGLRLMPQWPISLAAEYRWLPGDASTALENCRPSDPGWEICDKGQTTTANRTHILSGGVVLMLPLRRHALR